MKRILTTIFLVIMILTVTEVAFVPHKARALACPLGMYLSPLTGVGCITTSLVGKGVETFVKNQATEMFINSANFIIMVVAWFFSATGVILNISIILTMNIKAIYEATPAIDQLWIVIRNLSSIFIIFALLYTSIRTILGSGTSKVKTLIGNIVMAGLLINFSLFFTKVAIDTSNLVSLQFYRAIAPTSQVASITKDSIGTVLSKSFTDGGISDVFMQSLQIQKIYDPVTHKTLLTNGNAGFQIFVSVVAGSFLMIFAGLSFIAASVMFIVRLIILLLLMGFSPVYFAGMIFPKIQSEISDKWKNYLTQQLIFMPVYLFFMYVALSFISTIKPGEGFFAILGDAQANAGKLSTGGILLSNIGIILQYTIAFILINIPLMAALKTGGVGGKWAEKYTVQNAGKVMGGFIGQHSVGRGAKRLQEGLAKSKFAASNPSLAIMANKAFGGVAGGSFGGTKGGFDARNKKFIKERTEYGNKSIGISDNFKTNYIKSNRDNWTTYDEELQRKIDQQNALIDDSGATNESIREAEIEVTKLTKEQKDRDDARKKKTEDKYLESQAIRERKEKYASSLEKDFNNFTSIASKEAAKAIRSEMGKSEEKKFAEMLSKLAKENNKDDSKEKDESKPPKT